MIRHLAVFALALSASLAFAADELKELNFGIGDGALQYYLYNYASPEIPSKDVGLILL